MRAYDFNGLTGCVVQRRSRRTGTLVGLYVAKQAGIDTEPALPWATVCEDHSAIVCHPSLKLARESLPEPAGWCEECREAGGAR